VAVKSGVRVRRNCNVFNLAMENVLKGLPDKIRDQLSRHHIQIHFKCTHFWITFKLRDRGDDIGFLLVRDSFCRPTAFFRLAGAVGRQRALHKENNGFASPTLGRHISTFRGYQILFSIRNPYINRFTNHFSIHS
jgi:hypothetical protein